MDETKVCASCGYGHRAGYLYKPTFPHGNSKICIKNCTNNGLPLNPLACKHSDNTPTVSVSKAGAKRSIPPVENIVFGIRSFGIQYDTGCQLSLISRSALQTIPASMYSLGNSNRVRVLTYAGEGRVILTTKVKLRLNGYVLKLSAIEDDLNNGSGFYFPTPPKWRTYTGTSIMSHSGQISILLGGDNHLVFPS